MALLRIHENKYKALKLYRTIRECKTIYTETEVTSTRQNFEERPPHVASSHDSSANNHDQNDDIKNSF
jgi:bisphosphoglycerate-dependent phosphoglycerate mutase